MKSFALVLFVSALALTGCAAEPAPVPTVTTTVTATPAPVARAASDPLTELDAWLACSADVRHEFENASESRPVWNPYNEASVTKKDDGFEVVLTYPDGPDVATWTCDISGTVGDPTISYSGVVDL